MDFSLSHPSWLLISFNNKLCDSSWIWDGKSIHTDTKDMYQDISISKYITLVFLFLGSFCVLPCLHDAIRRHTRNIKNGYRFGYFAWGYALLKTMLSSYQVVFFLYLQAFHFIFNFRTDNSIAVHESIDK